MITIYQKGELHFQNKIYKCSLGRNGIKKIKHISFGTDENLVPVIKELCKDEILELFVGNGIQKLIYEKVS